MSPVFKEIIFTCMPANVDSWCGCVQALTSVITLIARCWSQLI